MSECIDKVHFSIEGSFITNLARERFYQNHDLGGAIKLLTNCLQCDELTDEDILMLSLKILNGNAEIVGTYPNDDYGINYINKDSNFDLIEEINHMSKTIKRLESESQKNLQKFLAVLHFLDLSEYRLKELETKYYSCYGEHLFPNLAAQYDTDLQLIDKYNKQNPVESFISHMKNAKDDDYGWLEPDGTYHPVEWARHSEWAAEYLNKHYPFKTHANMYWITDANGHRRHVVNGDCLVYQLHWVLLHNPHQGIAYPQYDTLHGMTKAQKEFLFD